MHIYKDMSKLDTLQNQIDNCTTQIASINSTIDSINNEAPSDPAIIDVLAARKSVLQRKLDNLTRLLDNYQVKYNEEIASVSYAFTVEQQAIVDTLLPQHKTQMDALLRMTPDKKTDFFTLYAKALTSTQQTCVVCNFFNM